MGAVGSLLQRLSTPIALAAMIAGLWLCAGALATPAGTPPLMTCIKGLDTPDPQVWLSGVDGSAATALGPASSALLSPDGSRVAAVSIQKAQTVKKSTLLLYTTSGAASSIVTTSVQFMQLLAWSADSKLILVAVGASPAKLQVINVASDQSRTIATGVINGASFAPSSSDQVVYARATPSTTLVNIFITSATGTNTRQLTHDNRSEYPLWGPTGIVYSHEYVRAKVAYPELQLWFIKPSGAGARQLTHVPVGPQLEGLTPIAFSANGKHLLANFVGQDPQDHTEAYTVDLTGSKPLWRDLTGENNGNIGNAISTDGKTILVTKGMTANVAPLSIETIPWSGGKPTTIVAAGAYASWNR
jgi:Tol biopolymer transport system component